MNQTDIQPLVAAYHRRLSHIDLSFKRYLYTKINWNVRLVGIRGARGVGKTTLLLQHIKETYKNVDDTLWVSMDNLWFKTHDVDELVEWLYNHGKTTLYFDEVHKCPDWTLRLKNYYDSLAGWGYCYFVCCSHLRIHTSLILIRSASKWQKL